MQTTLTPPSSGQPCSEPHRCCWLLLVAQVIEALPKVSDEVRGLVKEIKAGNASVTGVRIRTPYRMMRVRNRVTLHLRRSLSRPQPCLHAPAPSLPVPPKSRPRPCFQTNFVLACHESKIETMRRLNENVQRAGKKLLFSNRVEDVENTARK